MASSARGYLRKGFKLFRFCGLILRILITGASGFIGLPLVQHLVKQGHEIFALSRNPSQIKHSKIMSLNVDLDNFLPAQEEIRLFRPEIVIHLAWQDIPDFFISKIYVKSQAVT